MKAELIARPVEVWAADLEATRAQIPGVPQKKGQIRRAVQEALTRKEAVRQKASAVWTVARDLNVREGQAKQGQVLKELSYLFPGQTVSIENILEPVNQAAYNIHCDLAASGENYQTWCHRYACEPEVKMALYERALPESEMVKFLSGLAEEMRQGRFKKEIGILVKGMLSKFAVMYTGRHIVRQYMAEHGMDSEVEN